jgi:GAF domain-containing protein
MERREEQEMNQRNTIKAELERRTAQLAVLSSISREIATAKELGSMLDKVLCLVQESFGYHHVGLYSVDREQGELVGHLLRP